MYKVDQQALVQALAAELRRQHVLAPPEWAAFAKTGMHRERPPMDENWWYTRAAAVLRTVYLLGPIGTEKLRVRYGGRKNRGVAPDRFYPAGGNHLRKILQQLEAAKLVAQAEKGVHKGRVITPLGRKLIHAVSGVITAEKETAKAKPPKKAKEPSRAEKAAPKAGEKEAPKEGPSKDGEGAPATEADKDPEPKDESKSEPEATPKEGS